jgi:nucleoside-triphosphatase
MTSHSTSVARRSERTLLRPDRSGKAFPHPAIRALEQVRAHDVAIIDELGRMELASEAFRDAFATLLDRPVAVVAIVQSASHSFTNALRRRRDVETLRAATTNRNELPELLAALLRNAR